MTTIVGDCREVMAELDAESVSAVVTDPPYDLTSGGSKGFMSKDWDGTGVAFDPETWRAVYRVMKPGAHLLAFGGTRTSHRMICAIEDAGFEIRDNLIWCFGSGFPKSANVSKMIDKVNGKHLVDFSEFGRYIRDCRESKGMTLGQLDEAMGTNTAASWWEGRKSGVQLPSKETYQRLKRVLDMNDQFDGLIDWAEAEREVIGGQTVPIGHAFAGPTYGGDSSSVAYNITAPATDAARQWDGWGTALKPAYEMIV